MSLVEDETETVGDVIRYRLAGFAHGKCQILRHPGQIPIILSRGELGEDARQNGLVCPLP